MKLLALLPTLVDLGKKFLFKDSKFNLQKAIIIIAIVFFLLVTVDFYGRDVVVQVVQLVQPIVKIIEN